MTSFVIALPEAGEHAILTFDVRDFELLEAELGEDYVAKIFEGLDRRAITTLRRALTAGLKGGDVNQALNALPLDELCMRVADAFYLRIHGRTLSDETGRAGQKSDA
jgi:hypothetical protein